MPVTRRHSRRHLLLPVAFLSAMLTGCGKNLDTLAVEAMDACIAARNPLFTSGRGAQALDTPLPPAAEETAMRLRYPRASAKFQAIAESAADQVTLVCALDIISRWKNDEARTFVARYAQHPDAAVATAAERLTAR